ncbi:MAG: class I SAM-dependent methyltransferase [Chitinophagales bacterium]
MNTLFRLREFINYLLHARGISNMHSPFVYDFMQHVLYDYRHFYAYDEIETLRNRLLSSKEQVIINDHGAGAQSSSPAVRTISHLLKTSASRPRQAQLLFRIAEHYQCRSIIELGTSLGISSMYLAASGRKARVITLEGAHAVADSAIKNFTALKLPNIEVIAGTFEHTFPVALQQSKKVDLIFFDGNHRKEPTIAYFHQALPYTHENSIFIFDDIHWSSGMKEAWEQIKAQEQVTLSIDLFYFGIVFFRKQLSKQNFLLRF